MKNAYFICFALIALSFSGCGILPPSQEMSDARQRLKAAYEMDADKYIPFYVWQAEEHINAAQNALEKGEAAYKNALFHAHQAKQSATQAYQYALQFHQTRQAVHAAAEKKCLWRDTEKLFEQAVAAAGNKNIETALKLARQAQEQALAAVIQQQVENLRYAMQTELPQQRPLSKDQQHQLRKLWPVTATTPSKGIEIIPGVYSYP